ncbi:MAG: T9SS type A sorting domain-containing protein [Bacteroidota bacterium]
MKPSIGLSNLPADNDVVCNIPLYLGSFDTSGLQAGDTAFDFKLYDLNGDSFVLSEKLSRGKPVLLVAGNYTCPVFRNKLAVLNSVTATYGNQIEIAIIYTVEAHPIDTSPYFGYVNVTQQNQNGVILYHQPSTYGERKTICDDMLQNMSITSPVFIDGPCNAWWSTYGPAPNNAYLIDTNGIIFAKHDWFDRHPQHDIICDIDSLLGMGGCSATPGGGAFILQPVNPTVSGYVGEVLYAHVNVINTTANYVNIGVKKTQANIPASWESAFCFQVCFSPTEDSITIQVAPYDTADFSCDFFTLSGGTDSGSVKVGFRNTDDISNGYSITFRAWTVEEPTAINTLNNSENPFTIFPNPSIGNQLQLSMDESLAGEPLTICNTTGSLLYRETVDGCSMSLNTSHFPPGIYFLRIGSFTAKWVKK